MTEMCVGVIFDVSLDPLPGFPVIANHPRGGVVLGNEHFASANFHSNTISVLCQNSWTDSSGLGFFVQPSRHAALRFLGRLRVPELTYRLLQNLERPFELGH
jgi:hypothetical protein